MQIEGSTNESNRRISSGSRLCQRPEDSTRQELGGVLTRPATYDTFFGEIFIDLASSTLRRAALPRHKCLRPCGGRTLGMNRSSQTVERTLVLSISFAMKPQIVLADCRAALEP